MPERRPPGRPPGPPGSQRTALLRVRVSPEERDTWQAAADRAGVPLSEWVRGRMAPDCLPESMQFGGAASPWLAQHVPQPVPQVEQPPSCADGQQHGDDGEGV